MSTDNAASESLRGQLGRRVERITSGIDWLSLSIDMNAAKVQQWYNTCVEIIQSIATDGNKFGAHRLYGYEGFMSAGCFVGWRTDGIYCQLAGRYADVHWQKVYREDANVSRLDIQSTIQYVTEPPDIAGYEYESIRLGLNKAMAGLRTKAFLFAGTDGSGTLYIGAPSSAQRGRVYNKAQQSREPMYERCWRYEITLRNELADDMMQHVAQRRSRYTENVHANVVAWYARRGIGVDGANDPELAIEVRRTKLPSDVDRTLNWLRTSVRRPFQRLIAAGYAQQAYEAIGIDNAPREGLPDEME